MPAISVRQLQIWKAKRQKFAMLTAYDYSLAGWVLRAGIPVVLVGDSLGQVMLGFSSTLPVTMADMVRHTAAVARGAAGCLVVADMPFLSYTVSVEEAVRNAGRLIQEGSAQAVKLEGGRELAATIAAIVRAGIPVMAHIGLRPQSIHRSGYGTQAASAAGRRELLADARAVQAAGAFAVVVEKVPAEAAAAVTRALAIPTIGCGAGPHCDGQVLVTHDVLGLFADFTPTFARRYAELGVAAKDAMAAFAADVAAGRFPGAGPAGKPPRTARRRGKRGGAA